jgi:uncharacterized protein YndB with AHSA1/START domain
LEKFMPHELSLTRLLDAPAEKLFRCWTTPELIGALRSSRA